MRRPELRSTFARAVVPVAAGIGFFALLGLLLWGVAAVISSNSEDTTDNLAPSFQEIGNAEFIAGRIAEEGPIILPDLIGDDRNIVLDHTNGVFQIYLAHPLDRDATCAIEQVQRTRQFIDCDGRRLEPEDLALPPAGVGPIIGADGVLTLDLRADVALPTTTTTTGTTGG